MHDPDILAIQRKRRQAGECMKCGRREERRTGRPAVLCEECRALWAYCPNCEKIYARRPRLKSSQATEHCNPCRALRRRANGKRRMPSVLRRAARTRAEYLSDVGRHRRRLLPKIIRRYRLGETVPSIAQAIGLTRKQLDKLIQAARRNGEWPDELRRKPSRRQNHGKPEGHSRHE